MFIGHFAVGFAAKRCVPATSLGWLIAAPCFLDILWPWFLLAGWETVHIAPGDTAFTPLEFVSYPVSHSLLTACVWAAIFAGAYWSKTRNGLAFRLLFAGVVSHWLLDFVSHRPDMPLYPGGPKFGLGLWNSIPATLALESAMFAAALYIYSRSTAAADRIGRIGYWAFVIVLIVIYLGAAFGPPAPSVNDLALTSLGLAMFPVWAGWFDRHRRAAC